MAKHIDLNCDMGESYGAWKMGQDEALLDFVTSANIACGYHAGDPATMQRTVQCAVAKGVALGAHPSLPDLQGFGRRTMAISPEEARGLTLYQMGALDAFARAAGSRLRHVKAHGALYNMVSRDAALADGVAGAVAALRADPPILVALAGSALAEAGLRRGLEVSREAFADRAYAPDGSLAPRSLPGAVIREPELAAEQAVRLARDGFVRAYDGREVRVGADTLCVHGDSPGAVAMARLIRERLGLAGIAVRR